MSENTTKTQAFKLKGRLYTFTVLQVLSSTLTAVAEQLAETVTKAPKLFENTAVILDLSLLQPSEVNLIELVRLIREYGMLPIAIQGGSVEHSNTAKKIGLALLHASTTHDKPIIEHNSNSMAEIPVKTKRIITPVRSGQQIVAKGSDLIVAASVSPGAELLSDGNVHIYGALRGRVLAGISGDVDARIFCQSLDAELISIAGFYRLSDAIERVNGPCQIYLRDEHIVIEPL